MSAQTIYLFLAIGAAGVLWLLVWGVSNWIGGAPALLNEIKPEPALFMPRRLFEGEDAYMPGQWRSMSQEDRKRAAQWFAYRGWFDGNPRVQLYDSETKEFSTYYL